MGELRRIEIFIENRILDRYWKRFVVAAVLPLLVAGILFIMVGINPIEWYQIFEKVVPHGGLKFVGLIVGSDILIAAILSAASKKSFQSSK